MVLVEDVSVNLLPFRSVSPCLTQFFKANNPHSDVCHDGQGLHLKCVWSESVVSPLREEGWGLCEKVEQDRPSFFIPTRGRKGRVDGRVPEGNTFDLTETLWGRRDSGGERGVLCRSNLPLLSSSPGRCPSYRK